MQNGIKYKIVIFSDNAMVNIVTTAVMVKVSKVLCKEIN